jgi:hypothetical protein
MSEAKAISKVNSSATPYLISLPTELVVGIFEHLVPDDNSEDMYEYNEY